MVKNEIRTQWHPAFNSAIRMELRKDERKLAFYDEYLLNSKPLQADMVVIKKSPSAGIYSEVGKCFKGHNLIEYKSPDDTLGIDCFFKTYAYACLYKAAADREDGIPYEDITITFIRESRPEKLLKWLIKNKFYIEKKYPGIYYISKEGCFDIQIIAACELDREHKWLRALRGGLKKEEARALIKEARALNSKAEREYADSVLHVAIRANRDVFEELKKEADEMCEALMELMAPELEEAKRKAEEQGREEGLKSGLEEGLERGLEQGLERGLEQGLERGLEQGIKALIEDNLEEGRTEERIIDKLVKRFALEEAKAKEYYDQYACATG